MRLFRTLVVFGASLTGGVSVNACSGGVDVGAAEDASADGAYAKISPAYGNISWYGKISPAYGKISPDVAACPPDGGGPPACAIRDGGATDADASDAESEAG